MYALMIASRQLKLLVHAHFYVLPIWRKEAVALVATVEESGQSFQTNTNQKFQMTSRVATMRDLGLFYRSYKPRKTKVAG